VGTKGCQQAAFFAFGISIFLFVFFLPKRVKFPCLRGAVRQGFLSWAQKAVSRQPFLFSVSEGFYFQFFKQICAPLFQLPASFGT
jgi:hypothetical protein